MNAVIDKDLTAALLAGEWGAQLLIIPTAIDHVYLDYGTPASRPLSRINLQEAKEYCAQGKFEKGSILPKIEAAVDFLSQGGERVIITSPENLGSAVEDSSGTHIVP